MVSSPPSSAELKSAEALAFGGAKEDKAGKIVLNIVIFVVGKNIYGIVFVVFLVVVSVLILQSFGKTQDSTKDQGMNFNPVNNSTQKSATTIQSISPVITMAQGSSESSELTIQDLKVGEGEEVKTGDIIVVNYVGALSNGQVFDSSYSRNKPFEVKIGVSQVIPGWDKGIIGMKKGGKRRLVIQPSLAYGQQGIPGTIPPDSTLIFEVELVDIKTQ